MKFTDLFIRRPVLASVVSLFILALGLRSFSALQVLEYPKTENGDGDVTISGPGADPVSMRATSTTTDRRRQWPRRRLSTTTSSMPDPHQYHRSYRKSERVRHLKATAEIASRSTDREYQRPTGPLTADDRHPNRATAPMPCNLGSFHQSTRRPRVRRGRARRVAGRGAQLAARSRRTHAARGLFDRFRRPNAPVRARIGRRHRHIRIRDHHRIPDARRALRKFPRSARRF